MIQKILIFMFLVLLGCQNNKESEVKSKEKLVVKPQKIVQKQKIDSIKKVTATKTTIPSRLTKNYLYFICNNNKVILVKKNVASGEFNTFLVENINCSTSNLMYNNNPVGIMVRKKLTLTHRVLEAESNQYTYVFEKIMLGKKITEIPKATITPSILDKIINMGNGKRLSYSSIYLSEVQLP